MKVTCDYCGVMYDDKLTNCPNCGSPNNKIDRTSNAQPKTISELQEWFRANGYDYYKTRFFIGIDYKDPKAFGIYKDDAGDFVVYKNKANGERAIRYHGSDEEYAVNEIWQRFQQEIINQKNIWLEKQRINKEAVKGAEIPTVKTPEQNTKEAMTVFLIILVTFLPGLIIPILIMDKIPAFFRVPILVAVPFLAPILASYAYFLHVNGKKFKDDNKSGFKSLMKICLIFFSVIFLINGIAVFAGRKNGYYSKDNELYYRAGNDWYQYESMNSYYNTNEYNDNSYIWHIEYNIPSDFTSSGWNDYKNTNGFEYSYQTFESTSFYDDWKSGGDSDGWSSNDWDSGYTDWNSDW